MERMALFLMKLDGEYNFLNTNLCHKQKKMYFDNKQKFHRI